MYSELAVVRPEGRTEQRRHKLPTQQARPHALQRRLASLRARVALLPLLRRVVDLPRDRDMTARQWSVIETQLHAAKARLMARLDKGARAHLPRIDDPVVARHFNALLGEVELDMAKAFVFFDTYMDVLTQRHARQLGSLLAGCDALAWEAIPGEHPALAVIEPPLVACNRGFGAAILREAVPLPDGSANPMPLIQIPYTRLKEKYNLTSVIHEVGHEVMVRLGLVSTIPEALRLALRRAGAPRAIRELYALWASEIAPDFWAFCASGLAAAGGLKEVLALAPARAFHVSWTDPHPPPYLRARLAFDWCRRAWGQGIWDEWEQEWQTWYPLDDAPAEARGVIQEAESYLGTVGKALLTTKFRALGGKAIPDLFDLPALVPARLSSRISGQRQINLRGLSSPAQLAVFRLLREQGAVTEGVLDKMMTRWLIEIGARRRELHARN